MSDVSVVGECYGLVLLQLLGLGRFKMRKLQPLTTSLVNVHSKGVSRLSFYVAFQRVCALEKRFCCAQWHKLV